MANAIEVRGLNYRADRNFEIRDLNLTVPCGSIYGFLGPNGAGKSTTIRLLLGMAKPLSGTISILDQNVPRDIARILARVGYVPERPHLYAGMTGAEMIRSHSAFYATWDAAWSAELQKQLDIPLDRRIARMSKGEVGKLMILLALSQRPELLVLDEPTDGLDPMVRRDVFTAVLHYVADAKATVFVSSHLVHELERMCDWVGLLDHGRLVAELPITDFKQGVKRLRLSNAPADVRDAPFALLSRTTNGSQSSEVWIVRGWHDGMVEYVNSRGGSVREVIDLDLEDVFVEYLRSSRIEVS
jgi:ABC-2 type transport system ATP-binding protein